ncbi:MAG: TonB family protein [Bacteroides sp.]
MSPELVYFLKVNIGIILLYGFYRMFLYKDTFFSWRRTILIGSLLLSLYYPLLNIEDWIKNQEQMSAVVQIYATNMLPEYVVSANQSFINWEYITTHIPFILYGIVTSILLLRFFIQFASILKLHFYCKRTIINGVNVHLLEKDASPFSFFHWIFIHKDSKNHANINEILIHEQAHANQCHSIDVITCELMSIFFWYNPFIWLIRREIRENLEFLADNQVLESGYNSKAYQYNLLKLSDHNKTAVNLLNNFNVLSLKKRIKMMNKKRTKKIGMTKYLMFIPMAIALMVISNIESVARTTKHLTQDFVKEVSSPILSNDRPQDKNKQQSSQQDKVVFEVVEEMPIYPGGQNELMKYLAENIKYPATAVEKNIEGRVIVQFIVESDGHISNPKIVRSIAPSLDAEAIRVVNAMPKWTPGKQRGKNVAVRYTLPIMYRLPKGKSEQSDFQKVKSLEEKEVVVIGYNNPEAKKSQTIFKIVEEMPQYPGGEAGLLKYMIQTIKYPKIAVKNKEEGKVLVQMVIDETGDLSNVKIVKSVSPTLDAEAIRVVSNMPKWKPGKQRGQAVAVEYTMPVLFRLQ